MTLKQFEAPSPSYKGVDSYEIHEMKTRPYPANELSQTRAVTVDDMVDGALSTPTVLS